MIIYLHGFNSSPHSFKATYLQQYLMKRGMADQYVCPALPTRADEAIALVEAGMAKNQGAQFTFVGSSLGGFYATWLAEKHTANAVLINPAITPHLGLRDYLGTQQNFHSGEQYELTEAHLAEWEKCYATAITPSRYLLLVETGDEVLDYREAVTHYKGARQVVVQGGDHSLQSFPEHVPLILKFAGLQCHQKS